MKLTRPESGSTGTTRLLLFLIVATGALLRLYNLPAIPLTHDEFSAIFRTQFGSFSELIEKGVMVDGHPAGVQVFLYYYIKLAGTSAPLLKLPFILSGILAIFFGWLVGRTWFGATTGLAVASFIAFLQFPVMYSQMARPYASGLLFSLVLTWLWTKVLFFDNRRPWLWTGAFSLSLALCAYNHHFSMFFAVMAWITGLFFLNQGNRKAYFAAGAFGLLLYLPHLPVLFTQLHTGGIEGWLNKPRFDFIFDYTSYIFHFSWLVGTLLAALVVLSLVWSRKKKPVNGRLVIVAFAWFIIPFLTGYAYSVFRSAVLQYSVLIFSFPFLLLVLFSRFRTTRPLHQVVVVALSFAVLIPSLIFERQHFRLFYRDAYREIVAESVAASDARGSGKVLVLLDSRKDISRFYLEQFGRPDFRLHYLEDFKKRMDLQVLLDTTRVGRFVLGTVNNGHNELYPMISEVFPYLEIHKFYSGGEFLVFSRERGTAPLSEYLSATVNTFEPSLPDWGWVNKEQLADSVPIDGEVSFDNSRGQEYSPTFVKQIRDLMTGPDDVIDISADLRLPAVFPAAWLVITVTSGDKFLKWQAMPVNDFIRPGTTGRVYQSLRLSDIDFRHHGIRLTAFIWDPGKSPYTLDNFSVRVRKGNPLIYRLYRKIG